MDQQTYFITFDDASPAEASSYADELRNTLLDAVPDITVQRIRSDPTAQDFGTTLALILGAPATVAVATAIGNWLRIRHTATLTFKSSDEQIIIQNITSKDATRLGHLLITPHRGEAEHG